MGLQTPQNAPLRTKVLIPRGPVLPLYRRTSLEQSFPDEVEIISVICCQTVREET